MPGLPHTMPDSDEEAQKQVLEAFGIRACLWQIRVVRAILNGEDVITIAPTGSGKSLTYWMPLLFIKHGITVVVTPLKLLRGQFVEMLQDNSISAVSITASNATNELFEVILLGWLSAILLTVSATCQTCAYRHTKLRQSLWKIRNT
jgi:superfamily II DNA helicase RecQ